jgi:membrane protein YdbS with pleckstrin-like domain
VSEDWQKPSPRLSTMRRVQVAAVTVPFAIAIAVLFALNAHIWITAIAVVVVAALGLVVNLFVQRRVHAWGYWEREDDLLVRRGVMFTRLSVVPYGRMQFVDVTAGPFERTFGLATVRMHTAAAASDARIPGLAHDDATHLRDQLAALGEAKAAGL